MPLNEEQKNKFELTEQIRLIVFEELEKRILEGDIDKANVNAEQVREIIREELPALLARSIVSIEGNLELLDGRNIIVGSTTGTKIGTATGQKLGFFNQTPAAQQASAANLTNNVTAGGVNNTIDDFTNLVTYSTDAAAIRNAIYQLARKLKQINDGLRSLGFFN